MQGRLVNLTIFFLSAILTLDSCLREDPLNLTDGIYIKGEATTFNFFDVNGLMSPTINEVDGQLREGLYEIFIAVGSESEGFNIIEVVNNSQTLYGPTTNENIILTGENGQITGSIQKGIFGPDAGAFTVPENGLYHIIIDKQTSIYVISPVSELSLYGHAVGEDWIDTDIPLNGDFHKSNLMFGITGLDLAEGEYRFRYGHGDKIEIIENEVKVYTSFGGLISGSIPSLELSMVPGGNNYLIGKQYEGTYIIDVIWTVGESFTAQMTETSTSNFPEKLFIIGDGISTLGGEDAWNWDLNDFEMIPVYSKPHLFWKIVWLNDAGEIRFAPQKTYDNDFGKEGEEADGLYTIGEQDINVPGSEGYYMVTVNFNTNQVSISQPQVYLIGDVVGSWTVQNPTTRFSVLNSFEVLTYSKYLATGILKMYAWHDKGWFTNWWNAEFNIYDGKIKYVGNQPSIESVYLNTGGYTFRLNFRKDEAVIEKCDCTV